MEGILAFLFSAALLPELLVCAKINPSELVGFVSLANEND
jgi:hypothetical protein